ncbi:hypothetical protein, partial [Klebsiella pneumoniae]|uniref:hypothetical protein n=1 Tax=Klebsiella pneumoniae TaxID=573 RepID=UPI0034D98521
MNRLKMRVVLGNGRVATKYLIAKESQVNEMSIQLMVQHDPFQTEIMMYETVLKEMEYLMDEFEDTDDILWCNLVHYVRYKTILLEDL